MSDVTTQMGTILDWLCRAIAARAGRERSFAPLVLILWGRLRRTLNRFNILVAKIRAGQRPPAPRKRASPKARPAKADPPNPPPLRLPTGFDWVGKKFGWEVRGFGSQLHHLLTTDPEMRAMLLVDPRMARLLRPLCRMLGVDPASAGLLPPLPRRPRSIPSETAAPAPALASNPPAFATPDPPPAASRVTDAASSPPPFLRSA